MNLPIHVHVDVPMSCIAMNSTLRCLCMAVNINEEFIQAHANNPLFIALSLYGDIPGYLEKVTTIGDFERDNIMSIINSTAMDEFPKDVRKEICIFFSPAT